MNERPRLRARIWDVRCEALDLILVGSFDWRELHNLIVSAGEEAELERCRPVPLEDRVFQVAHALSHRAEGGFARALERRLDAMHAALIERVDATAERKVVEWCLQTDLRRRPPVTGHVWAVATDPREAVVQAVVPFLVRLRLASMRCLQGVRA